MRTRCPLCSRHLSAPDIRPLGVVFPCPHCDAALKVVPSVPKYLPMVAYLGWLVAFASWGVLSFWALVPLAFIATLVSVSVLSAILNAFFGVSVDPVTERGTLPLGETREKEQDEQVPAPVAGEWILKINPVVFQPLLALAIALIIFAIDWSGFNKWEPDLFFPKPLSRIWWHFPIILAIVFIIIVATVKNDRSR